MPSSPSLQLGPLAFRWSSVDRPLPIRALKATRGRATLPPTFGQPWHATGPAQQPFDFSRAILELAKDIVARTSEFSRLDVSRILFTATQARGGGRHGLQARVTPLRFQNGQLVRQRRGVPYQVQRFWLDDVEFLYLMTFCLPRYLDQAFDDKLITLFHELHHIHPDFNGDLRRHAGRCHLHTSSKRRYDKNMADLARGYLHTKPNPDLLAFLRLTFAQLADRRGVVQAIIVPRPKLIPLPAVQATAARGLE